MGQTVSLMTEEVSEGNHGGSSKFLAASLTGFGRKEAKVKGERGWKEGEQ